MKNKIPQTSQSPAAWLSAWIICLLLAFGTPITGIAGPEETVKVTIQANDQMKYDVTQIQAKPSQPVQITLKNIGTMPKVSMGHNLVVLDGKIPIEQFLEAGQTQMANNYVAPEMKSYVIASTKLLGPGESDTITFKAPTTPGDYLFICSFPGHYAIGMKGVLSVKK